MLKRCLQARAANSFSPLIRDVFYQQSGSYYKLGFLRQVHRENRVHSPCSSKQEAYNCEGCEAS